MDRREFINKTGWTFVGLAATGSLLQGCPPKSKEAKKTLPSSHNLKLYWGDIHNHCNLTYGHGNMRDAFEAAREQLDFVSVTPHAMWEDIPGRNDMRLQWVIDYHTKSFDALRAGKWDEYVKMTSGYNKENEFLTFLSYECHDMAHGDHVALLYDLEGTMVEPSNAMELKARLKGQKAFVTPHHMGYQTGFRGYNWKSFQEDEQTPFVEMYSRHGLAESDDGDYNYLHDMGPRQWAGTVLYGLEQGHKFGIIGSTDQHAGYPGSYGDGRVMALAPSLKRDDIWNALQNRNVGCATGDKIKIDFRINDAIMGEVIRGNSRRIYLNVEGENSVDYVDIIKNGKCIARMNGPLIPAVPQEDPVRCKIKMEFGWNREEEYVHWNGRLSIDKGIINRITPCFRGAAYTSPQPGEKAFKTRVNRVLSSSEKETILDVYSTKNPNTMTPTVQGVILDVTMPKAGNLTSDFNGKKITHSIGELLQGSKSHFMIGWLSEAILFGRAIPENAFQVEHYMEDTVAEREIDYYYVRVRQKNQQWAWSSPIWVEKR